MNNVSLVGRLVRDPELRFTKGDDPKAVTRFTVAVNRRFNREKADFIGCQAWGKLAEIVAEHCTKGSQVGVVGRIETGQYDKDGKTVYTTDIVADEVEFVGKKGD
jgi:single-strand DNA-binding protein